MTAVTDAPIRFLATEAHVSVQFPGGLRTLTEMTEYKKYRRKQVAEMRPYKDGDDLNGVSISDVDRNAGSPKPGDMILVIQRITLIYG